LVVPAGFSGCFSGRFTQSNYRAGSFRGIWGGTYYRGCIWVYKFTGPFAFSVAGPGSNPTAPFQGGILRSGVSFAYANSRTNADGGIRRGIPGVSSWGGDYYRGDIYQGGGYYRGGTPFTVG
jgi:hypothetical protein